MDPHHLLPGDAEGEAEGRVRLLVRPDLPFRHNRDAAEVLERFDVPPLESCCPPLEVVEGARFQA